ncbi:hypothetical protein [Geomicrobium sp. JCM 19039]|uniref:hypothetical protein n=1 Tax=Geomicrobium sp. JCM 19039 TaxID=1460636 RepID=UPI00045F1D2E|nr:hypothetical protein [Geomicrobium sp. JCM 19039]GAK10688.1 hypothetical protein JCM19039_321 [Geomicrobium sp. JCM 19039]
MNKKLMYGMLSGVFAVGMLAACGDVDGGDDPMGEDDDMGGELDDGGMDDMEDDDGDA